MPKQKTGTVAATNFSHNLDPAVMRRFTFKLEFGYLDDSGKKSFFERMFKTTLSEDEFAELRSLRNLAPGDFRTVRRSSSTSRVPSRTRSASRR